MMPRNFLDDQPTIPANSQQADIYQPKATNQPQGQVSASRSYFYGLTSICRRWDACLPGVISLLGAILQALDIVLSMKSAEFPTIWIHVFNLSAKRVQWSESSGTNPLHLRFFSWRL